MILNNSYYKKLIMIKNTKQLIYCIILFITMISFDISFATNLEQVAETFISNTSNKTLEIINSQVITSTKSQELEELFIEVMDIDWMAKFAIAKFWKDMSEVQKNNYLKAYKNYLIKTYVPKFQEYNNQIIKIINTKDIGNSIYIVSTQIVNNSTAEKRTINIGYRCKVDVDNIKIRDIIGEDFSLLSTQRSEFASVIANGNIDKLIKILLEK